jgi:glycosyltransferase AglD
LVIDDDFCIRYVFFVKSCCLANLSCFQGIGWSLFINHLTPFKVGDVIRASAIIHKRKISWDEAFHSVFVLRIIDIVTLLLLSSIGFLVFFHRIPINIMLVVGVISIGVVCVAVLVVMKTKSSFILKHITLLRLGLKGWKGAFIITIVSISWMMEGIVLFATLHVIGIDFTFVKAVWVNSVTVGGQVFQVAPGGLGTYESIMSTMLVLSDLSIDQALNIAVYTHSFKFIFSYIIGIYVVVKAPLQWRQILSQRKKGEQMK